MHYGHFFLYTRVQRDINALPKGARALIFAMFIYMVGWGIFGPFLSILIHNIVQNYALAGLFYGLLFLVGVVFSAPLVHFLTRLTR